MRVIPLAALVAAAALISACEINVRDDNAANQAAQHQEQLGQAGDAGQDESNPQSIARAQELARRAGNEQQRAQMRRQALQEMQGLRVVVDISDRKLRVFAGDRQLREHDVAVGSEEWPTPTGNWQFHRVDLNPEWNPPKDEEWAEDRERKAPGDPDNPMGQARLVYRMPNTVHGTDDLNSLGKAVSHGSIRVANEVAIELAEILLKAGDAWEGEQWFRQMVQNRTEEYHINLQTKVPIEVQQ